MAEEFNREDPNTLAGERRSGSSNDMVDLESFWDSRSDGGGVCALSVLGAEGGDVVAGV